MTYSKVRGLLAAAVLLLALAGAAAAGARERSRIRAVQETEQAVVRFHIRANSDSQEDQELKMQVKNAVAQTLSGILSDAGTKEETERLLETSLEKIEKSAGDAVRENGSSDEVSVSWGEAVYPEKRWGDMYLPAGRYESLIVCIGEGKGHNWWCTLYPLLGFSDILTVEKGSGEEKILEDALPDAVREVLLHPERVKLQFRWFG